MTSTRMQIHALRWPKGWTRTETPLEAPFSGDLTVTQAAKALYDEVSRLPAHDIRITVADGTGATSRTAKPLPGDQAAAVYFTSGAGPLVLACDRWSHAEHNLWALKKHVEAVRGCERWGVGSARMAWVGYNALPPSPRAVKCTCVGIDVGAIGHHLANCPLWVRPKWYPSASPGWRGVFGFKPTAAVSRAAVVEAHMRLALLHHPDVGGDVETMKILNVARDEALEELGNG